MRWETLFTVWERKQQGKDNQKSNSAWDTQYPCVECDWWLCCNHSYQYTWNLFERPPIRCVHCKAFQRKPVLLLEDIWPILQLHSHPRCPEQWHHPRFEIQLHQIGLWIPCWESLEKWISITCSISTSKTAQCICLGVEPKNDHFQQELRVYSGRWEWIRTC